MTAPEAGIPRPEHPRPQLVRPDWRCLNGTWQFEIDRADTGLERGLLDRPLAGEILVPFAPESTASGIGDTDFLHAVWYRRELTVPAEWEGRDVLLHLGAVDHDATVWVDGVEVGRHRGGFTPFTCPLAGVAAPGDTVTVVVRARDTPREPQARGKQATWRENSACFYTRTTGIWQTVWLEAVPRAHVRGLTVVARLDDAAFTVTAELTRDCGGLTLEAVLADADGEVVRASSPARDLAPTVSLPVPAARTRPWCTEDPHLYGLTVRLLDGEAVVDEVESYAGLRTIAIDGNRLLLNGEPVFQRLVLDQGYWPDTLMTAPSDAALVRDIELGLEAGFNGARLHQKVFEERYLFHADRLGYLVWGEFGDWGAAVEGRRRDNQQPTASFLTQWLEVLRRDRNHPSIVGWCPLNETYQALEDGITQLDDVTHGMYLATKLADPTRPVLDASGYAHRVRGADVYDSHDYEQSPLRFAARHAGLGSGAPMVNDLEGAAMSVPYEGQPFFISEFGGIWWNAALASGGPAVEDPERAESWGYGQRVRSEAEWHARFAGLTRVLLRDPGMFGYCYTQLTDVFQEENGLYDMERRPKVDIARVRAVQAEVAAYEAPGSSREAVARLRGRVLARAAEARRTLRRR